MGSDMVPHILSIVGLVQLSFFLRLDKTNRITIATQTRTPPDPALVLVRATHMCLNVRCDTNVSPQRPLAPCFFRSLPTAWADAPRLPHVLAKIVRMTRLGNLPETKELGALVRDNYLWDHCAACCSRTRPSSLILHSVQTRNTPELARGFHCEAALCTQPPPSSLGKGARI